MRKTILLIAAMLAIAGVASANEIWLITKSDHLELIYGHDVSELYNPAKISELKAWDVSDHPVVLQKGSATEQLTIVPNKQAAMITVVMDNGYWVQASSTEWKNVTLDVAHGFRIIRHSMLYHKSLYAWNKAWSKPAGLKLEIVPLDDPFKTLLGKKLTVQVFYNGKPLPGAKVSYGLHGDKALSVIADKNGKAKILVTPVPEQFIASSYDAPGFTADGAADTYTTSLRYELK